MEIEDDGFVAVPVFQLSGCSETHWASCSCPARAHYGEESTGDGDGAADERRVAYQ